MLIQVADGDWGLTNKEAIQSLLLDTSYQLNKLLRDPFTGVVIVEKLTRSPVTIYRTLDPDTIPAGPITIGLTVRGCYWSQFIYQFAHEFCHVLSNFEYLQRSSNKWFHEAICEIASLYSIWSMGREWAANPPLHHGKFYASLLMNYITGYLCDKTRALPPNTTIQNWLANQETMLRSTDTEDTRQEQHLVANLLWPFFEGNPSGWNSIRSLPNSDGNLAEYLDEWRQNVDAVDRDFVSTIRDFIFS